MLVDRNAKAIVSALLASITKEVRGQTSLVRDSFLYLAAKAVPGLAGAAGVALFVWALRADQYGRFALLWPIASVTAALAVGWLNQGQLRFYGFFESHPALYRRVVSKALGFALLLLVCGATGVWLMRDAEDLKIVAAGTFAASVLMIHMVRLATLQAQLRPKATMRVEIPRSVLHLCLPLALFMLVGRDFLVLTIGVSLAYLVATLSVSPWPRVAECRPEEPAPKGPTSERPIGVREMVVYGWPMSLWLALTMAFQVTDRLLIEHFYSFSQTGGYAATYELVARSFSLVLYPVTMAAHPRIMNLWNQGDREKSRRLIRTSMALQSILLIPFLGAILILGPELISLVLPEVPEASTLILPIAGGAFMWQVALLAHKPLELLQKTRTMLCVLLFWWVTSVLLNYWLLPGLGVVATAYSYLIAGAGYAVTCIFLGRKLLSGAHDH